MKVLQSSGAEDCQPCAVDSWVRAEVSQWSYIVVACNNLEGPSALAAERLWVQTWKSFTYHHHHHDQEHDQNT